MAGVAVDRNAARRLEQVPPGVEALGERGVGRASYLDFVEPDVTGAAGREAAHAQRRRRLRGKTRRGLETSIAAGRKITVGIGREYQRSMT